MWGFGSEQDSSHGDKDTAAARHGYATNSNRISFARTDDPDFCGWWEIRLIDYIFFRCRTAAYSRYSAVCFRVRSRIVGRNNNCRARLFRPAVPASHSLQTKSRSIQRVATWICAGPDGCGSVRFRHSLSKKLISPPNRMAKPER